MAYLEQVAARAAFQPQNSVPEDWPDEALQAFVLRMADHGHCISRTFMKFDRAYALEQLRHAHTLADAHLRELAMALFRHFERTRSGIGLAA